MHSRLVSALIAAFMSTTALGQVSGGGASAPDKPGAMRPAPRLPPEGKRWVDGFLGKWRSNNVRFTAHDKDVAGTMTMSCTR